jgi:predicted nucleotidyltransferase
MSPIIIEKREAIEALCRKHGVKALWVFGSAVRDDCHPASSDLDLLVEFLPRPRSGFDDAFFRLIDDLQRLTGRAVDLIEYGAIRNPFFRASIDEEKVLLYAA